MPVFMVEFLGKKATAYVKHKQVRLNYAKVHVNKIEMFWQKGFMVGRNQTRAILGRGYV